MASNTYNSNPTAPAAFHRGATTPVWARRAQALRRGFVAVVEFADAYAAFEITVLVLAMSFGSVMIGEAFGLHLVS